MTGRNRVLSTNPITGPVLTDLSYAKVHLEFLIVHLPVFPGGVHQTHACLQHALCSVSILNIIYLMYMVFLVP